MEKQENTTEKLTNQEDKNIAVSINMGEGNKQPLVIHILAILGYFTFVGFFAAVIFAYIVRNEKDSVHKSLCRYYIRSFWITLGLGLLFTILSVIVIGVPLLIGLSIWFLYRVVKGTYYSYKYLDPYLPKSV